MAARNELANNVESNLSKNEQETGISFFGDSHRLTLTTYHPTLTRKTLQHPDAHIEWVYVFHEDKPNQRVQDLSRLSDGTTGDGIEGVKATLPIGALKMKGSPRNTDRISKVMNTPTDIESKGDIFGRD